MPPRPTTAQSGVGRPLTRKLSRLVTLTPDEIAILDDLQLETRVIRRNREIMTEGRKYDALLILIDGISIRCRILHDGRRQILNIALPGDFIGFPSAFSERALYSITALSDCAVAPVPFSRLLSLFDAAPKLAAAVFWSFACEAAIYAEHLIRCWATIGAGTGLPFPPGVAHTAAGHRYGGRALVPNAADTGVDRRCARSERPACQSDFAPAPR